MIYFHFLRLAHPNPPAQAGDLARDEVPYLEHKDEEVSGDGRRRKKVGRQLLHS